MNKKTDKERKSEKLSLRIRREQAKKLEKYRKENRHPSTGAAVRSLIEGID